MIFIITVSISRSRRIITIHFQKFFLRNNFDNSSIFRHYKKPTYTGRIIHSLSTQPYHYKFNTAVNLKEKWLKVSDASSHDDIINELGDYYFHVMVTTKILSFHDSILNRKIMLPIIPQTKRIFLYSFYWPKQLHHQKVPA